jgi:hypothetical protein
VASLAWTPPTSNVDGSSLSDLSGYRIRYGTSASELTQIITINDASTTAYQIKGLAPATYFFAIQSFTAAGAESELSGIASKTIT